MDFIIPTHEPEKRTIGLQNLGLLTFKNGTRSLIDHHLIVKPMVPILEVHYNFRNSKSNKICNFKVILPVIFSFIAWHFHTKQLQPVLIYFVIKVEIMRKMCCSNSCKLQKKCIPRSGYGWNVKLATKKYYRL